GWTIKASSVAGVNLLLGARKTAGARGLASDPRPRRPVLTVSRRWDKNPEHQVLQTVPTEKPEDRAPGSGGRIAMTSSSRRPTIRGRVALSSAFALIAAVAGGADAPKRGFDAGGDATYRPVEAVAPQPLEGRLQTREELQAFVDGFA